jgi:hypothetical protein
METVSICRLRTWFTGGEVYETNLHQLRPHVVQLPSHARIPIRYLEQNWLGVSIYFIAIFQQKERFCRRDTDGELVNIVIRITMRCMPVHATR